MAQLCAGMTAGELLRAFLAARHVHSFCVLQNLNGVLLVLVLVCCHLPGVVRHGGAIHLLFWLYCGEGG